MTIQEVSLKSDLISLGQAIDTNLLENCEYKFNEYLADLQVAMDELKRAAPQTIEERHRVFLLKKRIVDTLLAEARID